ncbi:hypothetical protein GN244_ATG07916 [Phytophthora infestans]|uniref:Uncharacterized protein n=1 Tax=Phytophthora infestans TaxID=4787 RepID=A0A833SWK3_PHYIN|nr:hypothetical protein GN244_ATG07916 [Phytophthora infestans]
MSSILGKNEVSIPTERVGSILKMNEVGIPTERVSSILGKNERESHRSGWAPNWELEERAVQRNGPAFGKNGERTALGVCPREEKNTRKKWNAWPLRESEEMERRSVPNEKEKT